MSKLVFDVGGMSTKVAIFNDMNKLLERDIISYEVDDIDNVKLIESMNSMIKKVQEKHKIECICISMVGLVNTETTQISGDAGIKFVYKINFKRDLNFKGDIFVENDAYCAALCQLHFNKTSNSTNSIVLISGTGIGGAIIVDNKLHKGVNLLGGNAGLMLQKWNEDKYDIAHLCSSTRGLMYKYKELTGILLSGKEIFLLSKTDVNAQKAINFTIENMAQLIINTNSLVDANTVFIGGGISQNNIYMSSLIERVDKLFKHLPYDRKFKIEKCIFDKDANIFGALSLSLKSK